MSTGRSLPSIKRAASAVVVLLVVTAAATGTALLWVPSRLEADLQHSMRAVQGQAVTNEIARSFLLYQRSSNVYALTDEPEIEGTRNEIRADIRRLTKTLPQSANSESEQALLGRANLALERYFASRAQAEREGASLDDILRQTQSSTNEVLTAFDELGRMKAEQAREALEESSRVRRISRITGLAAAGLMVLILSGIAWGAFRYLVRPLIELRDTVARHRCGDTSARASQPTFREVADLSACFDELADSLQAQRQAQLTFLAGVAHDLRNPLAVIKMGIHALDIEPSEERRTHNRQRLDRQVERVARMVDDLLDATRIESGNLELRAESFDLKKVLEDLVELYRPTAPDHDIVADLPDLPIRVNGDPLRIEQVASNLLSNAIKYSPGGGTVVVRLHLEGDRAGIVVSDQGVGIEAVDLEDIFQPFRRRHVGVAGGAGLGLSVARKIVEAHGGRIDAESRVGHGATFRVSIPVQPLAEDVLLPTAAATIQPAGSESPLPR